MNWILVFIALIINLSVTFGWIYHKRSEYLVYPEVEVDPFKVEDSFNLDYWNFSFQNYSSLLEDLEKRKRQLDANEQSFQNRLSQIEAEKKQLVSMENEMIELREEIDELLFKIDAEERARMSFIAKTYSAIPPEQVVPVLLEMKDEDAVKLISQMKPQIIAPIFTALINTEPKENENNAQKVAFLTAELAKLYEVEKE